MVCCTHNLDEKAPFSEKHQFVNDYIINFNQTVSSVDCDELSGKRS
jgi:hypothetical protein